MAIGLQDITVGVKADIEKKTGSDPMDRRYFSTIIDSTNAETGELRMVAPLDMLAGYRIQTAEMFRLYLRMNDMLFQAWCVAIGYERSNNTILLVARLADNSQIINANRRNDYRIKVVLEAGIWRDWKHVPSAAPIAVPAIPPMKCLTYDISTGGLGLLLPERVEKGDLLLCQVALSKEDIRGELLFGAEIVRLETRDRTELYRFSAGMRILSLSPACESLLLRYSLACQREALRQRTEQKGG